MVSVLARNLRDDEIPSGVIVLSSSTSSPPNFAQSCGFFDKFPKNVPNLCTCPGGSCFGVNSHTTPSTCSSHTHGSTPVCHNHTLTNSPSGPTSKTGPGSGVFGVPAHAHPASTSGSTSVCVSAPACCSTHCHSSICSQPPFKTFNFVKSQGQKNLRDHQLPINTLIFHDSVLSNIPSNIPLDACSFGKYPKHILNACTCPSTTGGCATHTHGASGCHAHASGGAHTHTGTPATNPVGGNNPIPGGSFAAQTSHTHSIPSVSSSSIPIAASASHCHDAGNNEPEHIEFALIKVTTINLRNNGFPINGVGYWECPLACIPTGYQVPDGSNGTSNALGKYVKTTPNACTCPGSTGGATTHGHGASGSHAHAIGAHNHPPVTTGTTPLRGGSPNNPGVNLGAGTHTHTVTVGCQPGGCTPATTHTHATSSNDPISLNVALIERLA